MENFVFIIDSGHLYRVDTNSGEYYDLGGGWNSVQAITIRQNFVYIIDSGHVYKVNPETGGYDDISSGWSNSTAMG